MMTGSKSLPGAALVIVAILGAPLQPNVLIGADRQPAKPNIVWLTCEDIGPELGCYGDGYADTPNLDRLASEGLIYLGAWSNAPVCAPARTCIISGMYATSTGAQHMRSLTRLPEGMRMYPQMLREAGYYCTNNVKEDYNLEKPGQVWDESSRTAHWKNRSPGQPFFAVFNSTVTHESMVRKRPHEFVHDPKKVRIPQYHPDTPEVRKDWAQYYDNITEMDGWVGDRLKELGQAGLLDDTIVFFFGDHGPGMPRCKRFPYDSGLHVPLIVRVPDKFRELAPGDYRPGGHTGRLVSFVDLAPTVLSIAGVVPPPYVQGHAFMGRFEAHPQRYLFGFRGRMDERYDLMRSVRDDRFVYIRNYMPHLPYGQHVRYMFQTPTTRIWKQLYDKGKLTPEQSAFWRRKEPEELYDLEKDPDEVRNLAGQSDYAGVVSRMREVLREQTLSIRDLGFLPEPDMHFRAEGSSPYEVARDGSKYPLERILEAAELASSLEPGTLCQVTSKLKDEESAVRYWGALGILMRGRGAVSEARVELREALEDTSPCVRVVAAQALGRYGDETDLEEALAVLVELASYERNGIYLPLMALNAIDALGQKARVAADEIRMLPREVEPQDIREGVGISALLESILRTVDK